MGHADVQTTMRYLHYKNRGDEADRLGPAFQVSDSAASTLQAPGLHTAATAFRTDAPEEEETPALIGFLADRRGAAIAAPSAKEAPGNGGFLLAG